MGRRTVNYLERGLGLIAAISLGYWGMTGFEATRYQARTERALDLAMTTPAPAAKPPEPRDWLGRLEIPRFDFSTIVLEGDDEATLKLGVGHVPGTAIPGQPGNAALAGHRDTFFRSLRGIRVGDEIRWTSPEYSGGYRVESTRIVSPSETDVLKPTDSATLTLITCYPFNFIGPAPQRFIVRARHVPN